MTNSFFLPLDPDDAAKALHDLNLERFNLKIVPIPADGGCVVAVLDEPPSRSGVPGMGRLRRFKQRAAIQELANLSQKLIAAPRVPALSQPQVIQ
jgi:hypothetical protein